MTKKERLAMTKKERPQWLKERLQWLKERGDS